MEEDYWHYIYENHDGNYTRTLLPVPQFPASVVRPFDFDHDGDMDLFVGARLKKGMFPYSNHSWLILNEQGRLYVNPASRLNLGMVTDAVWTDYDKDGWEDLLVSRELNTLMIVKNSGGKELVLQEIPGAEKLGGIWYSVIAGDFDQDGDDDYIAGNLGENHRFTLSEQYPMNLYVTDIDLMETWNHYPLRTENKEVVMTEYPVNYLDELWGQSNFFRENSVIMPLSAMPTSMIY
jgi:hypothetical protein